MQRCQIAAASILALAGALSACQRSRPVVLGVVTSHPYLDAARFAVEDELAAAPLPGFDTVMIGHGSNLASPAIEAARRLVGIPGLIAVVGHSNSAASIATAPIYNQHHVVQIAPTTSAVAYSQAGPFSFRLVPPDDRQGRFLAGHLVTAWPVGARVAIGYVNDDYGRGLRAAFRAALDTARYRVVLELPHVEDDVADAEVAEAAGALREARPDVIVWLARGNILIRFLPAIRRALPEVRIVGSDGVGAGKANPTALVLLKNVAYVDYVDLNASESLREFSARYHGRFGQDATVPDALTYDAVRLLIAGIRAGTRTGDALRAYLAALGRTAPPFAGVTGPIRFDTNGDLERSYVLKTFVGEPGG